MDWALRASVEEGLYMSKLSAVATLLTSHMDNDCGSETLSPNKAGIFLPYRSVDHGVSCNASKSSFVV